MANFCILGDHSSLRTFPYYHIGSTMFGHKIKEKLNMKVKVEYLNFFLKKTLFLEVCVANLL